MALALCLTLLPTAALAEETEGTAQTPPAVEEAADPANGEAKQESQSAEQEEQQEDSASKQDGAVAAVQAMIDALPAVDELDGMDDEALESACLAASDAYDAYDALTEDQQSALTGAEKMIAILEWANEQVALAANEDLSSHTHEGWTAINTATELTGIDKAGNYYLTDNVTLTGTWKPVDGMVLCLNGYGIEMDGDVDVIEVGSGVTFTLCDCEGSGTGNGGIMHGSGTGRGVYVSGGTFSLYNAKIRDNEGDNQGNGGAGAGVYMSGGTFHMYSGSICQNTAYRDGGGVYMDGGEFTMSGGTIEKNNAAFSGSGTYGYGGGVYINRGTFTMTGGSITNNAAYNVGGGVCVCENATAFTIGGNVAVTGNITSSGAANDVYLYTGKSIRVDGKLDRTASIGVTCAGVESSKFVTVATGAKGSCTEGNFTANKGEPYCIKVEPGTEADRVNVNLYNGLPHEHYRCNGKDAATGGDKCTGIGGHTEEGVLSFKAWTSATQLPTTSGEYYLTKDVTLDSAWSIKGTGGKQVRFVLCLNGHSIRLKDGANDYVINVGAGGTLALCDCDGSKGTITGSTKASGVYIDNDGAFVMYGGSISGNGNGVTNKELFQMYGGSITGNDCGVENLSGIFTMYDGSITGNRNTKHPYGKGGGVAVEGGTFDMHGGSITGNSVSGSSQSYGGGVFVDSDCRFTMDGGSITGNTAGGYGGGVYVDSRSTAFTVSGDVTITSNTVGSNASSKTSNVYLPSDKTITVGGKLGENAKIGVTTANAPAENSYLTIANGVKYTLTEDDLKAFASDSTYGKQLNGNSVIFTNGDLHIHAVCGKTGCTDGHGSDEVWLPLTYNADTQTLHYGSTEVLGEKNDVNNSKIFHYEYKLPTGNYYLKDSITLSGNSDVTGGKLVINGDVNLCLNGKTLSTSVTDPNVTFITVNQNCKLTLSDCDVKNGGTITSQNKAYSGVQTIGGSTSSNSNTPGGKFTMYGGTIAGMQTGVITREAFAMYGGTITKNDKGVDFDSGTMTVGGDAKVKDNTKNVSLPENGTITIDESLTDAARIGVRLLPDDVPAGTAKKQFATGANSSALNYGAIFSCDNGSKYVVSQDTDGKLHFALHQHSWTYELSTDGQTITAHCDATGCSLEDGLGGTLTLVPPTNPTYDGQVKRPEIKSDQAWNDNIGAWKGASTYYRNGINVNSPIDAGEYKARYYVTGGENAVAEVTYTIAKATPKLEWNGYPYGKSFTGSAIVPPTASEIRIHDGSNNALDLFDKTSFKWYTADKTPLDGNPIDAGDYIIEATIAATNNTESATITKGLTVNKATDLGGYDKTVPVAVDMYPSSAEKVYTVDLDKILAEKEIRSGGSLALNATLGIQTQSDWVNSAVLEGTTVKITMKALPSTNTGLTATVNVNLTSRNYKVIPVVITLTLQKKPTVNDITVSMDNWTYGEEAKEPTYTVPAGVTAEVTYAKAVGTALGERPTDAGSYTVTVSYETDTEIHTGTAEFTIAPKTLTADDLTHSGPITKVYDTNTDAPSGLTVSVKHGSLVGSDTLVVSGTLKYNSANVNEAKQIIFTPTAITTGNYALADTEVLTITGAAITKAKQAPLTVTSTSATYGEDLALTVSGGTGDGAVTYTVTNDTGEATIVDDSKLHPTKAGTVSVTATKSGGDNYEDVTSPAKEITIGQADYNGTASKTVNIVKGRSTAQTGILTAADFFPEGQMPADAAIDSVTPGYGTMMVGVTVNAAGHALEYLSNTNITATEDETYTVTVAATNYKDITATLTFHPTDKLVQDGFKFETGSVTKTYGDEDFTLAAAGAAAGSIVTYESSEPAVATVDGTGKVTIKGAGTAVITAKASATEDYDEAAATCTLTVGKKPITIPTADATVFTYNGTEQTYALAEDGAYTITGNKQTNANETGYDVTVALKDTANTQWADGTTANKTYTFVIGKAVITVKAKDQSAYVGDKVPALSEDSYTVSGLVGEEKLTTQPTVKYVGADGKEITPDMTKTGEVKISASGAAASGNYTIRYEDGKLTVSTRPSSGGGGSSRPSTHPVQAEVSKDPDGTVSLSKTNAAKGDKVTITVKPDRHYEVDEVIVRDSKGKQLAVKDNGDGTFTFEMPADKVTVEPTFSWVNPFADVANSAYYVDAVEWMLKREVTQGTTETTFSPNLNCTRAQIVTFLWRAASSPEPKGTVSFADVSAGSYYAKAVAWAVENGITGGTGDGLFSPDAACTRAQSAAFLYRAAGSPAVNGSAGFSDVAADAYYAQAVAWAKEHGITGGIGGGLFGSANDCTRAQIAAFLWRLYAEK